MGWYPALPPKKKRLQLRQSWISRAPTMNTSLAGRHLHRPHLTFPTQTHDGKCIIVTAHVLRIAPIKKKKRQLACKSRRVVLSRVGGRRRPFLRTPRRPPGHSPAAVVDSCTCIVCVCVGRGGAHCQRREHIAIGKSPKPTISSAFRQASSATQASLASSTVFMYQDNARMNPRVFADHGLAREHSKQ